MEEKNLRDQKDKKYLVSTAAKETPPGHWAHTDLLGWGAPSLPVPTFMGRRDTDRSNFSQRLDKLVLYWNGRAHESVSYVHVITLHLMLAVLHGKQLTAVLKVYPPASLGLTVPGYVTFSNPLKGFLDFVIRRLLLSQDGRPGFLKCSICQY